MQKEDDKKIILQLFLIGGFIGWIIDTLFRSIADGKFSHAGYLENAIGVLIPFLPVYGIGLVIIYLLQPLSASRGIAARAGIYAVALTGLEYMAGVFTKVTLGMTLWDYTGNILNLKGFIDFTHTFFWVILAFAADYGIKQIMKKIKK